MEGCPLAPMPGKIVVELDLESDRTNGGIYIPDTARKAAQYGEVLACGGPTYSTTGALIPVPYGLHVGTRVAVGRWAGVELEHEGRKLVVFDHSAILAIVLPIPAATPEVSGVTR